MKKAVIITISICLIIGVCILFFININQKSELTKKANNEKYSLLFHQRKDSGIKEIYDTGEYKVKTFGGDVTIAVDNKEYSLEDALKQKVITPEDIISKAEEDAKSNVCKKDGYWDGGSIVYEYSKDNNNKYTILKLHTIQSTEGNNDTISINKDLVIGFNKRNILDLYNENK